MKYENIFPTGILVHDVPVWVAKQVEKLVEERVDKLQRPDDNAPHATDYFEKEKVIDLKYDTPELMSEIDDRTIQSTPNKGVATPIDFKKLLASKNISLEDMAINDYRTYAISAYVEYTLK